MRTVFQSASLKAIGGAATKFSRCANVSGGGASKVLSRKSNLLSLDEDDGEEEATVGAERIPFDCKEAEVILLVVEDRENESPSSRAR